DDAPRLPATHYGVYKVANEDTARVYWDEHKVPSMGFRPLSVYGPGRDFGVTADPTLAMKSAVLGRAFKIRWGGRTDLVYTEDVARALTAAAASRLDRERGRWLANRDARHPVIVAEANGEVVGWGSLNVFNPRDAYRFVADFSVYVERAWRGKGVGRALLEKLIELARQNGFHKLVLSAF